MIPASYKKCILRCTLPPDKEGSIGIGLNCGNDVLRLQITKEDACRLAEAITNPIHRVTDHSEISSGIPRPDVSPAEQENV